MPWVRHGPGGINDLRPENARKTPRFRSEAANGRKCLTQPRGKLVISSACVRGPPRVFKQLAGFECGFLNFEAGWRCGRVSGALW
jgi:hypothetical protein